MIARNLKVLFLCAAVWPSAGLLAQDSMASPMSPNDLRQMPGSATQDSNTGGDTVQNMRDKSFLRKAAEGGLAEIEFGHLAAQKGASDEVKTFGQKMVDDHTKLNEKMAPIADSMGVTVPRHLNKEDQAEYDKLSSLSGDAFDKEYITAMVKDHHTDLREFRAEANSTTDPTIKQAVSDGAIVIHEHMVMIDKIARSKGIATPGERGKQGGAPSQ